LKLAWIVWFGEKQTRLPCAAAVAGSDRAARANRASRVRLLRWRMAIPPRESQTKLPARAETSGPQKRRMVNGSGGGDGAVIARSRPNGGGEETSRSGIGGCIWEKSWWHPGAMALSGPARTLPLDINQSHYSRFVKEMAGAEIESPENAERAGGRPPARR